MIKINLNCLFPLTALIILTFTLSNQLFNIPPLGKTLSPFIGIVQNDEEKYLNDHKLIAQTQGISDSVNVFFDNAKVPHIYAKNLKDLYFSQGYVTAMLRLWQMDFTSYVSAGRLSEIFDGENYVNYDRNQRRIGMLQAAENSLKFIEKNPETKELLSAYTKGVNSYINQLTYRTLPFEYKLLNYKPEQWSNLKSVLIMKLMANTLSGYENDIEMSKLIMILGEKNFNLLYPDFSPNTTPMINYSRVKSSSVFNNVKRPAYLNFSFISSISSKPKVIFNPRLGSNSWVISGKKTKSGYPILASDPHLNLTLPSIWLQMQLTAPGLNVYGVSIPGTPAIIIGFNDKIAWGITNGADDVKDWYKLQISEDYKTYKFNGKAVKLNFRVEEIKRKGQMPLLDTIYNTELGPIVNDNRFSSQRDLIDYAMKWELATPSNEFLTFLHLNKATNYQEYREALKYFSCPIQNFTFACSDGNIAVSHQGRMAIKSVGQGRFILDGSNDSLISKKYIPFDSLPQQINPKNNYLISANQHPTDSNYNYYYNGFYLENRANQIDRMLAKENHFDVDKVKRMQLDNTNSFAVSALPILFKTLDKVKLSSYEERIYLSLKAWQGNYDYNNENAKFFELLWTEIKERTWDEFRKFPYPLANPDDHILLKLIDTDPSNVYFDVLSTSRKEDSSDIIVESFEKASNEYLKLKNKTNVKWGNLNRVNFFHLTHTPAFSKLDLPSAGYPEAINAISSTWGPSWRMIVQLGKKPVAYGIYPGGQSGNIGSKFYDNSVNDWLHGKYYHLNFYSSIAEAKAGAKNTLVLK